MFEGMESLRVDISRMKSKYTGHGTDDLHKLHRKRVIREKDQLRPRRFVCFRVKGRMESGRLDIGGCRVRAVMRSRAMYPPIPPLDALQSQLVTLL